MSTTALLTVNETCRELSVCRATVYGLVRAGRLPVVKIGAATRIRRADVEALIERQLEGGEAA